MPRQLGHLLSFGARGIIGGHRRGKRRRRFALTLSDADPLPIAHSPAPGTSEDASRADHLHPGLAAPVLRLPALTKYCAPGWDYAALTLQAFITGQMFYIPIYCPIPYGIDRVGVYRNNAAVGLARLGLYAWDDAAPAALIEDYGTVNLNGTGPVEITVDTSLPRGWSFLALVTDVNAILRGIQTNNHYQIPVQQASTTLGGFPTSSVNLVVGQQAQVAAGLSDPAVPPANVDGPRKVAVFVRLKPL